MMLGGVELLSEKLTKIWTRVNLPEHQLILRASQGTCHPPLMSCMTSAINLKFLPVTDIKK